MREIVFLVTAEQPGRIEATAPERGLVVEAPTLEELHHEARDALIRQVGPSHGTYRILIRRNSHAAVPASGDQPAPWHPWPKARPVPTGKPATSPAVGGKIWGLQADAVLEAGGGDGKAVLQVNRRRDVLEITPASPAAAS